ncbi:MAG: hypothetical protein HDR28_08915 [Lachnospiraceae bacterium]|nr:hypothetical protein [Lachnospiraceae bacterium]
MTINCKVLFAISITPCYHRLKAYISFLSRSEKTIQGSLGAASAFQLTEETEVSSGRTNTKIEGIAAEFAELGEKTLNFYSAFRAGNPQLSGGEVVVNLYIDVEL